MEFNSIEEEVIYEKLLKGPKEEKKGLDKMIDSKDFSQTEHIHPDHNAMRNEYFAELSQRIAAMEKNRISYPEYMMPKQPFYRPIKKIRYFAKKAIKKSINWSLGTAYERQTEFNNSVVPAIGRLTELQSLSLDCLDKSNAQTNRIAESVSALETQAEESKRVSAQAAENITAIEAQTEEINQKTAQIEDRITATEVRAEEINRKTAQITESITATVNQKVAQITERITAMEAEAEGSRQTAAQTAEHITVIEARAEETKKKSDEVTERISALEGKIQVLEKWFIQSAQMMESVKESYRIMEEQGIFQQIKTIKNEDEDFNLAKRSLSQSGEDIILSYILRVLGIAIKDCSYLDLGANHAKQYSNTYYFYDKGARGVLVEANPSLIPELKLYRNEDVILNCCISDKAGDPVDFYVLNGDGLSTPDKQRVDEVITINPALKIDRIVPVKTMTVSQILETYFDKSPVYMNIDLEGDDMAILSSIDWETYRPLMISIEMIPYRPRLVVGEKDEKIIQFMESIEYIEYAFTGINSIFLDRRQIKDVLS